MSILLCKYKKEDLPQVNPQLYAWLAIINDKSPNATVLQNGTDVNKGSLPKLCCCKKPQPIRPKRESVKLP